jgi:gliding motility-associated-like protein
MSYKRVISIVFFIVIVITVKAQTPCSNLGQTPGSAFPVCGTDTFFQATVPACGGRQVPSQGCNDFLTDINPYWYRFTCFESGKLGFVITPNQLTDDYDWQLFDITNKNPDDIYTDVGMFVACNWSGEQGITGASAAGTSLSVCGSQAGGPFRPLFSAMPDIIAGHEYILLVSHFTVTSQSGYSLVFGGNTGGTASITDPQIPAMSGARAICDGEKMSVKLNKKMRCSSLNADGSDFVITPAFANIISAEGVNCSNGFDMDSVVITLSGPVPPGNYTVAIKSDAAGVNLLDNCGRSIADGQSFPVTVFPQIPTPMDSLSRPGCAPTTLNLVFSRPMQCASITSTANEFTITGPDAVTVTGIANTCTNGLSNTITLQLASAIQLGGTYRVTINNGSDGNTILNECGQETLPGSFVDFVVADTVAAFFNVAIGWGCLADTIAFSHDGRNHVNSWQWQFDDGLTSLAKDTSLVYRVFGTKSATLTVSNGTCQHSFAINNILLDNQLQADFDASTDLCPGDPATFIDKSFNRVVGWQWDFGNGNTSTAQQPPLQVYAPANNNRNVPVRLIIQNDIGCKDTLVKLVNVVANCYIAVPKAFTPNNDGLNDYLYPTNAYKAKDLKFVVYNRGGQKIFETSNWLNQWDGTFKGNPQDPGTYVWTLTYTHTETGEKFNLKGTTVLIR